MFSFVPRAAAALVAGAGLLFGTSAALAGAGVIQTRVSPIADNVTYATVSSTGAVTMQTFVAYDVSVANEGGNTVNNIRFTAAFGADSAQRARYLYAEGASCLPTAADGSAIECAIGQFKALQSTRFRVFFAAPPRSTPQPPAIGDCAGSSDCLLLRGITFYAEGTGGVPNSQPINSTDDWVAGRVLLGTDNPTTVKSAVPRGGARLFTGKGAVPDFNDRFTTFVDIPSAVSSTRAAIQEGTVSLNCAGFTPCPQADLSILDDAGAPAAFASPFLNVVLRVDSTAINSGTRITGVQLWYQSEAMKAIEPGTYTTIDQCAAAGQPNPPKQVLVGTTLIWVQVPCWTDRREYKRSDLRDSTVPAELLGDFEWRLVNPVNGSYRIL